MRLLYSPARGFTRFAALGLAVVLSSSCTADSSGAARDDEAPVDDGVTDDAGDTSQAGVTGGATTTAAAELPPATIRWAACDGTFECGRLLVPRDYAAPAAGTVELFVKRRRARGNRIGALLVNPGGPGASAVDYLTGFTRVASALSERFDLVAFDPRGVGRSTPLDCHETLQAYVASDPSPDDDAEWSEVDRASKTFADQCAQKHGALLPHLGTPNVARDMDRVRAALGDEQISYLGYSYGTAIGAWYAELFPKRIRAMVLDGAVDLSLSAIDLAFEQGKGFDNALKNYFSWCTVNTRRCTWTSGKAPAAAYAELEAAVERKPLPALGSDRPAGPGEFALGVITTLYGGEAGWSTLSRALLQAVRDGDGSQLVALSDNYLSRRVDGSYANIIETNQAVNCLDKPTPDSAAIRAQAERFRSAAPTFGLPALTGLIICAHWPAKAPEPVVPSGRGAPPIVVIGTTGDPATPYAWAGALAEQLESGRLLTFEGEGHTAYGRGAPCIDRAVNGYLLRAELPMDGARCGVNNSTRELDDTLEQQSLRLLPRPR